MPLNFPSSPTDGQIYENYYYDSANSVWQTLGSKLETTALISNTPTGSFTTGGVDYDCVIFKTNGTLTVTRGGLADVFIVGGGGAGGGFQYSGGGGGAGGVIQLSNVYIPVGSHSLVVGAGGTAVSPDSSSLADYYAFGVTGRGGQSSLLGYTAFGGGTGSGSLPGLIGASAGGGGYQTAAGTRTPGIPGQGNDGGTAGGNAGSPYPGGGGGGAGAPGTDATSVNVPGNGGNGVISTIIPSSLATSQSVGQVSGTDVYFGGGGAGGNRNGVSGTAGLGGGAVSRGNGTANTGGGGAGNNSNGGNSPGNGGSGVVIVRWVA
jgi:hypothetical protein